MKLAPNDYALFCDAIALLRNHVVVNEEVVFVTIDKFGVMEEHTDEIFDDTGQWFSHGETRSVLVLDKYADDPLPDTVWRLLRIRISG